MKTLVGVEVWSVRMDGETELWSKVDTLKDFKKLSETKLVLNKALDVTIDYVDGKKYKTNSFRLPVGWEYDGASIPKPFWDIIGDPTERKFRVAAAVHDKLYGDRWSRELSDAVFEYLLKKAGVSKVRRDLMWSAVRLGGHAYYAGDTSSFWRKLRNIFTKGK